MIVNKLISLVLCLKRPSDLFDYVGIWIDGFIEKKKRQIQIITRGGLNFNYDCRSYENVISDIKDILKLNNDFLADSDLKRFKNDFFLNIEQIKSRKELNLSYNADFNLAEICYFICRAVRPSVVLETGVAYGVTTAFILQALEVNKKGVLYSIDLPPLQRNLESNIGLFVPDKLKSQWKLHRGLSKKVLPSLLREVEGVDIFIHDSISTKKNIHFELQSITQYLKRPSVIIVDDAGANDAFLNWVKQHKPIYWSLVTKKGNNSTFGICIHL